MGDDETPQLAASLGRWLLPVRLSGFTAPQATKLVTEQTVAWARDQGWAVALEVRGRISRPSRSGEKRARLDLVCARPGGMVPVAIEIDQFGKVWSLKKLLAEVEAGSRALWVRWRGRTATEVPACVGLVDIHETAAYSPPPQT